jgi:hypothetical protein
MFVLSALEVEVVVQYLRSTAGLLKRAVGAVAWVGKTILEYADGTKEYQ